MKKILLLSALCAMVINGYGQTYSDTIHKHRQTYKQDFINEERSPLKGNDTSFLRFFKPNPKYRVTADFALTPEAVPFEIPTHSGKKKSYRKYGMLRFSINNMPYTLEVYQSMDLLNNPKYSDHLFIPFNDLTNYDETYGGGRYLDVSTTDVINGKMVVDFNKSYNPYCAYSDGYNCPIPPEANKLLVAIKAGEKNYGKKTVD